jgi:hypothetical protein
MLHKDSRNKIRVDKPFLQLTTSGECHYQFAIGSWIIFDTPGEASDFIRDRLRVVEPDEIEEANGESRED